MVQLPPNSLMISPPFSTKERKTPQKLRYKIDLRIEIKEVKNDLKILNEKQKQDSNYFRSIIFSIRGHHDSSSEEK